MSEISEEVEKRALNAVPQWALASGGVAIVFSVCSLFVAMSLKQIDFPTEQYFMTHAEAYKARVMASIKPSVDDKLHKRIAVLEARLTALEKMAHPPTPDPGKNK